MMARQRATDEGMTFSRREAFGLAAGGGITLALAACKGKQDSPATDAGQDAAVEAEPQVAQVDRPSFMKQASLREEMPVSASAPSYDVEPGLANVAVPQSYYLDENALALLEQNGFIVEGQSWGDEFYPIYEENRYFGRANFVTVDSMMHTYHLYFQYLLKGLERGQLSVDLTELSNLMRDASAVQYDALAGTEWESAATRNLVFFTVASMLLDPETAVSSVPESEVREEVARIESASGVSKSIVTGEDMDYSQFTVRGYYAGDDTLERYFRTMMWYGLTSFYLREEDLNRSALLMTLALEGDALARWEAVYAVTSFFAGASDDLGYYEYRPAIEAAYGSISTAEELVGNTESWEAFKALAAQMRAPQINSLPGGNAQDLAENTCFRFMGQRFSIDSMIFQQLIYSNVGDRADGARRMLPNALDVPAAFGSDEALGILDEQGDTGYAGYPDNMQKLRSQCAELTNAFWQASLYNQWLRALEPLLAPKGDGYPPFMQGSLWARKQLESYLSSYTELKHDTVLYSKQAIAEGDGTIPGEGDDRGFVEAEPLLFLRLANLCSATSQGLELFDLIEQDARDDLGILETLSSQLADIAAKELAGELPSDEEFELIRSIGVQLEHFWQQAYEEEAERLDSRLNVQQFPATVVVDVASSPDSCLELALGRVAKMFVIVSVEGSLRVASGPVFMFNQFEWPSSDRLTDTAWRDIIQQSWMDPSEVTQPEPWTDGYRFYRR